MNFKSVSLAFGLCYAGATAAIGLGELNVRSSLGQPLHATVAVLGATPETTADCFSVGASTGSIAPLSHPRFTLQRSGGNATLHIRTAQAVNDPIAQFMLTTECESRLQREYVVLLDPPLSMPVQDAAEPAPPAAQPAATPAPKAPSRPSPKRSPAAAARPAAATAQRSAPRPQRAVPADAAPTPRLVLSGRSGNASGGPVLSLRYDLTLPDPSRPRSEGLTPTELSDENTALTRKLAYLETQLASLQQRNQELEARRNAIPSNAPPPPAPLMAKWPFFLLGLVLLAGLGGLVAWLRRRSAHPRTSPAADEAPWTHPDPLPALPEVEKKPAPSLRPAPAPEARPAQDFPLPARGEGSGTEVKEDVLNQAEVFMAFGHGELAIHLLQEHLREAPKESPVPWLLLLDLLQREGDTAAYAAASAECRRYININVDKLPNASHPPGPGLEAYPHVLEELVRTWNTPQLTSFFDELVFDHRGGTRIGFEPEAYRDILLLRELALAAHQAAA